MNALFELPDVVDRVRTYKRYAKTPDLSTLKDQQKTGFDLMVDFVSKDGGGLFLVEGYAGTGKTYLISKFTEWYLTARRGSNIAVTAPTNKAVKVLQNEADYIHTNLAYLTVHRLLGLKPMISKSGEQIFIQDKMFAPAIENYKLLVVDEVSMLDDNLFDLMYEYVHTAGLKIIFVGDPAQIPPINRLDCIPFNPMEQERLSIRKTTLTDVIRQEADNPIIKVSMLVRKRIEHNTVLTDKERTDEYLENKGVFFLSQSNEDDGEMFYDLLNSLFVSKNFKADADFAKVIAWRNKTVDWVNGTIRAMIYGDYCGKIEVGEKLIADEPIVDDGVILFTTNDEMEVTGYNERSEKINGTDIEIHYYATKVEYLTHDNRSEKAFIRIVHERSEAAYNKVLRDLAEMAKDAPFGSKKSRDYWKAFYEFKESFARVKYNYAITAHKAQGSTYHNTIVLERDMDANRKIKERNRIKYTAMTRPKYNLVIIK